MRFALGIFAVLLAGMVDIVGRMMTC